MGSQKMALMIDNLQFLELNKPIAHFTSLLFRFCLNIR